MHQSQCHPDSQTFWKRNGYTQTEREEKEKNLVDNWPARNQQCSLAEEELTVKNDFVNRNSTAWLRKAQLYSSLIGTHYVKF